MTFDERKLMYKQYLEGIGVDASLLELAKTIHQLKTVYMMKIHSAGDARIRNKLATCEGAETSKSCNKVYTQCVEAPEI